MVDYPSDATTLVLCSMFKHGHPDRRRASFMITKPGQRPLSGRVTGTEVNFDGAALLQGALFVQKHGAPHLRGLPVDQVESDLMSFVMESYHLLAPETFLGSFSGSYADSISTAAKASFTAAFATSRFFVEPRLAAVFPLVPITVSENYVFEPFFLTAPGGLATALSADAASFNVVEDTFPPVAEWTGRREQTGSWLGVRAPSLDSARKVRSVVLGAVALLPHQQERYTFSGRRMFGGHVTLSDRYSLSFGDAHTPALMTNLVIGAADRPWLDELVRKLATPSKEDRKHPKTLTYFYRAWAPDPVKRFPTLFAAIDAIFGDARQATQAVVDAVTPVMGTKYPAERIRLMLGLRAGIVQGGAPDVYESSKYQTYYRTYGKDAVKDMELIVARCLQQVIFPGKMTEHPHNQAEAILQHIVRAT